MKKKLGILMAALLCAVSLAACGKAETSSYESDKVSQATEYATQVWIPVLQMFTDGSMESTFGLPWDEYTMEETAQMAASLTYYYFGTAFDADGYGFHNAISSFEAARDTIGQIVAIGAAQTEVDDEQIIVRVDVYGTQRDGQAELIFSNDMFLVLKSAAVNCNYTLGEKMGKAGLNTLMGMGTVFVMLIIISLIISLFGFIPGIEKKMAEAKAAKLAKKNAAAQGIDNAVTQIVAQEEASEELADDTELVAVIAAAIAAYEGTSSDGVVIRSIRKIKR